MTTVSFDSCKDKHDKIDEEIMRIRKRLDGNGSEGLFSRLRTVEVQLRWLIVMVGLLLAIQGGVNIAPLVGRLIP